jgi:hypothetical protein
LNEEAAASQADQIVAFQGSKPAIFSDVQEAFSGIG